MDEDDLELELELERALQSCQILLKKPEVKQRLKTSKNLKHSSQHVMNNWKNKKIPAERRLEALQAVVGSIKRENGAPRQLRAFMEEYPPLNISQEIKKFVANHKYKLIVAAAAVTIVALAVFWPHILATAVVGAVGYAAAICTKSFLLAAGHAIANFLVQTAIPWLEKAMATVGYNMSSLFGQVSPPAMMSTHGMQIASGTLTTAGGAGGLLYAGNEMNKYRKQPPDLTHRDFSSPADTEEEDIELTQQGRNRPL